ncbi:response regulator [Shewanella sp. 10N.286.48.A6]|uniref:response regulator n=1 Tax=Shewanella sp. 10N.286.48.A6 TaxID=1880833 RepID=UPI000C830D77|nr:response regulator [Shewanella sp. 10N.286.48.A6]PMH97232.1 hypothetical protein BCU55_17670 [Shewanella sp. 10N.286.48.A6]
MMINLKYIPEFTCLFLFTMFSTLWVISIQENKEKEIKVKPLQQLELLIPQHKVQLLNANFSDQQHYDKLAQIQFEIESILLKVRLNNKFDGLLNEYKENSLHYIQLASTMKTSLRLIAQKPNVDDKNIIQIINAIRLQIFSLLTLPNKKDESSLRKLLDITEDGQVENYQYLKLVKLHSVFILENYELTAHYRQRLIDMRVVDSIIEELDLLNKDIENIQFNQIVTFFCSLFPLLFLFIIIIKRHQYALEETSELHRKAVEVKTQFLANMSHEIRTPMTGVIGLVELTLQTELNQEQRNYLEKVKFSADSLLVIINDILDFSKIESGKLTIENIPWEHNKLIDNLIMMLGMVAEDKGIELIFDISPDIPLEIMGDPVRVNQILLNLLSNAIKFTEEGHVIFKASLGNDNEQSQTIIYEIKDTGIGLSDEQQSKLFERFSQADQSTTRKYGGSGLGLAISKLLVDLMDGEINVLSKLAHGSTFRVTLPLGLVDENKGNLNLIQRNSKHLLLLENNKVTQNVIQKMAEAIGSTVKVSSSVKEAINLCQQNRFDIALVDWSLDGETGLDFINEIKTKNCCPETLVICSAYSQAYIEKHAPVESTILYLAKPLTFLSLSKTINLNSNIDTPLSFLKENSEAYKSESNQLVKGKNSILLVEDNKINQLIAKKLLTKLGFHVDLAENGRSAIELIMKKNYRVVLMDIQMPIMDGKEATIELRKSYSADDLNIIALTANITEGDIEYYKKIGMNGHLGKPYEIEKIREVLSDFYCLM